MSLPKPIDALLNDLSFLPRVSTHDGRAIEEACKGTLFDRGVQLRIVDLPFAPAAAVSALDFSSASAKVLAQRSMSFAAEVGAAAYLAPGLPLHDRERSGWVTANRRILEAACESNGTGDIEQRPVIAVVAPGRKALKDPCEILNWLPDLPVSAVYVQPLNLDPVKDSFEKLALCVEYLDAVAQAGLTAIAGRVGAFGLVCRR